MEKIDFKAKYHELYSPPSDSPQELTLPPLQFAMVDGQGAPEDSIEFQNAIQALYGVTYTLKFGRKKAGLTPDYTIGPLEGLWWMDTGGDFDSKRLEGWRWTLMVLQPDFISQADFEEAVAELKQKKANPALDRLRLAALDEGQAVQIMHIGPYNAEESDIQKLQAYAESHGQTFRGKHHEIYLGDPRRAKPEKLRTILRHPVAPGVNRGP